MALLDSDSEGKSEQEKKGFINSMKEKNWDFIEINNVFKNDKLERTFEDLFPQNLYIESFNEYCSGLKDFSVFDKNYTNYEYTDEINTPIIKTLEKHFFSFINVEKHAKNSITKQDIIRILINKTNKMNES
ncbi:MAG: hypothetical protein IPI88_10750 [Chitinophagaceae bacterium]|nr:hypothetical protein [Chitinophagaceae bacterium]